MKKTVLFTVVLFAVSLLTRAQQTTFPLNGIHDEDNRYYAFVHARLVVDPNTILEDATLLIRNGKVEQSGTSVTIPNGAVVYDLTGKSIYPAFIDVYSDHGMPEIKREQRGSGTQYESNKEGAFAWNQALQPEVRADALFHHDEKDAAKRLEAGFGALNVFNKDGISRGSSALVGLADLRDNDLVIKGQAAAHLSFSKGSSRQSYPTSLMGSIALLRQTYMDGQWYKASAGEHNLSLEAWNSIQSLPQIFEVGDKWSAVRADKIGDEFRIQYVIKGNGDEYQRIDAMKATGAVFILPVNFPEAYGVSDPYDALLVNLDELKHWEMAPSNPAALAKAGIAFALTADGLKDPGKFIASVRKAMEYGLTEQQALKALTQTPAQILKVSDKIGDLRPGKAANFLITSGPLFDESTTIYENWNLGRKKVIADINQPDIRGNYNLKVGNENYQLEISGKADKVKAKLIITDSVSVKVNLNQDGRAVSMSLQPDSSAEGVIRLSGTVIEDHNMSGQGQLAGGTWVSWRAVQTEPFTPKEKKDKPMEPHELGTLVYPNAAYGRVAYPPQETVVIRNATVWTNTDQGIVQNADVLIRDGKIIQVGKITLPGGAKEIDGTGKHVTPGIIDEHTHIAGSGGINEAGQAISAEVRVGDILNPDDINIYRQLSGGVTAAQVLHGSANPIGGQSAIIKLRWGQSPEALKIKGADGFIKFALGENVKWSNRSPSYNDRYPQTRMGVEQLYFDAFIGAREYDEAWKSYNASKGKMAMPRRDLELETLAEILNKKRFITCHSYVQSEINMLMHVADSMGFRVNTFTHILEGYKVADKMKAHGVGGSTFSDWWAYKYEVKDAIPYNGALMHGVGVTVAYNSDDAEMARRLNQEAAKAVKYGGVSEEEALKFVTLNPAKLLHLDNRMGSIKSGMDADIVIWSEHPLSIYARAEKTFVDGRCLYDVKEDEAMQIEIAKERDRLIQKMMDEKGPDSKKPSMKRSRQYHCETLEDEELIK
ncbi:MAG: amidohydrolase family protein [Flavobacteriales bacterium]|nr:amidohydrolase family protein [Flavobacteriales bacterium]